jgi:hypothetical protein
MIIDKKITQLTYTGNNLTLNTSNIKNNISTIYTINQSGIGYLSYSPLSTFNSLSSLTYGQVYLIESIVSNLPWQLSACIDSV